MQADTSRAWHILVVDDQPEETKPLVYHLQKQGWKVTFVSSGEQALARIAVGGLQAIICDLEMPGMGSYRVLEALASDPKTRTLPFLLTNSEWNQENWSRCAGGRTADCHIIKPYTADALLGVVTLLARMFEEWKD